MNGVFSDPSVASVILIYKKEKPTSNHTITVVKSIDLKDAIEGKLKTINIKQKTFLSLPNHTIIFANNNQINLIQKINNDCKELQHFSLAMFRGEELGKKAGVIIPKSEGALMVLAGEDINRYSIRFDNKFIKKTDVIKGIEKYLQKKIMIRQLGTKINATLDTNGNFITIQSVYNIITKEGIDPRYVLGIINSKVIGFYYLLIFGSKQLFPRILLENLKQLPIKEASDKEALRLIELVEKMLTYNTQLRDSMGKRTDNTKKIEEELNKIDFEINESVYKLYGITDKEKKVIEESLK